MLVYRVIFALYCFALLVYSGFYYRAEEKWFIYLTHWGFTVVTLYLILASALTLRHILIHRAAREYAAPQDVQTRGAKFERAAEDVEVNFPAETSDAREPMKWYHKAFWVIHSMAGTGSIVITILYWALIFKGSANIVNVSAHLFNSLFMIADTMLSSAPVHFLHFVYSVVFAASYGLFAVVYWAAGGTDPFGRSYIYPPFNFSQYPGPAAGSLVGVILACPLCHAIWFGFFKLRLFLSARYGRM